VLRVSRMVAANASERRSVHIHLIHDGVQPGKPLEEPLRFGLQDSKGEVSPGRVQSGKVQTFDFVLEVKENDGGQPVFTGALRTVQPQVASSLSAGSVRACRKTLGAGASKSPSLESIGPKSAPPKSPASDLPPMSSAAGLIPPSP
jgi:hypothetical protein